MQLPIIDDMPPIEVHVHTDKQGRIVVNLDTEKFAKDLDKVTEFAIQECVRLCKSKTDKQKILKHFGLDK
jgi:hypothetical protein